MYTLHKNSCARMAASVMGGQKKRNGLRNHTGRILTLLMALAGLWISPAQAAPEEIVIFADDLQETGKLGYELHLNYAAHSRKTSEYAGEQPPDGVLRFMPEFTYGLSDSWDLGLHIPMSYNTHSGSTTVDGFKVRVTNVNKRETAWGSWFYGANYELSYFDKRLSSSRVVAEVLGILGLRHNDWLVVINPIVGRALSSNTPELDKRLDLDINYKVMKTIGQDLAVGFEHYSELGKAERPEFGGTSGQITYAVVEFKTKSHFDFNIGIGHGWTDPADRLVFKAIVGMPF